MMITWSKVSNYEFEFLPNVPRQVSLAGRAGGSQKMGVKALGLLFGQQALCLNA